MADNEENKAALAQNLPPAKAAEDDASEPAWKKEIRDVFAESAKALEAAGKAETPEAGEVESESEDPDAATEKKDAKADPEAVAEDLTDASPAEEKPESEGEQGRDDRGQFTRRAPFSDSLVERAVKAGIPMSEVRQFQTEALLAATCGRLESVQKGVGETKSADKGKDGEAKPAADPVAAIDAIPDLSPEVYDEGLVKAFRSMKAVAKAQAEELSKLRGKESKDFFATQLEGVKEFTKGDQTKESAVREKFDTLKAGYKATGKDVSDVTVFKEASQLVLGGDMKAAAKQDKAEAAGRRSGQRISRAAGQRVTSTADPVESVVEKIQERYFT